MRAFLQNKFVRWVVLPIAILSAIGWNYYRNAFPTCTIRYKLTAEVMTPDGLKTGTSVTQVTYWTQPDYGGGRRPISDVIGEALYVDLGNSKNLFITLTGSESVRTPRDVYAVSGASDAAWLLVKTLGLKWEEFGERKLCESISKYNDAPPISVPPNILPTLVSFKNIDEPDSLVEVNPMDLESSLTGGYRLSKVTIAITNEQVTSGIEKFLSWYPTKKIQSNKLSITSRTDPLQHRLEHYGAYKQPIF